MQNPITSAPGRNAEERKSVNFSVVSSPIFILGPAYAGKSEACPIFLPKEAHVLLLGTALPQDQSMADRILDLKKMRPPNWQSIDVGGGLEDAVEKLPKNSSVVIDSLSQWLGEVLVEATAKYDFNQAAGHCDREISALFDALKKLKAQRLIMVSTEVGGAPPPQRDWTRLYRQKVGELNQQAARFANSVFTIQAGICSQIK